MTSHPVWDTSKAILGTFFGNRPFQLAAALSYYTLLSMAPLLLLLTGIAGLVFGAAAAREHVFQYVRTLLGPQEVDVVRGLMTQVGSHHAGIVSTVIGTAILLVGATTVFAHLQTALNQIWGVRAGVNRRMIWRLLGARLLALAIVLGMAFVLLVSMAASVALAGAGHYLAAHHPGSGMALRAAYALVSFVIVTGIIALLFKYVPDAITDWPAVLAGAAFTAVLLTLGKYALGVYLARLRYSSAGAAGSLILIVIWAYYSALILFLGAQTSQVLACRFGRGVRPRAHARLTRDARPPPQ